MHFYNELFLKKSVEIRMNKTVTLPVVLYQCETWFMTLMEDD
jgi:hypothetical protein